MLASSEVPEGWQVQTLGDLADYVNGRAFKPNEWGDNGLPIIRIEQINNPKADCDYFDGVVVQDHEVDDGDLLFSWSATLTTLVWNRGPAALNQHIFKVLPKRGTDLDYLHHLLDFLIEQLAGQAHGSTMQHIKKSDLLPYLVHVPPLPEQRHIAAILDSADEAIEETEALISKLKQAKSGLMHDLLTRGIDEHGHLRDPEANPEQFKDSPLGRIPEEWETPTFEAAAVDHAPICYGIVQVGAYVEHGVPVLAIHNLKNGFSSVHRSSHDIEGRYARSRVKAGDVLLSVKGTIGRVGIVPSAFDGNISRDVARIRLKHIAAPEYVSQLLSSPSFQGRLRLAVVGTTRDEISIGILKKIGFPLPPINEQHRITEVLDAHDKRIRAEEAYRDKLVLQKRGLMDDLLTGRVRVSGGGEGSAA